MPHCDEPSHPTAPLHQELGRLIARLADEPDHERRVDLADEAFDVLAVLLRREGAHHLRHPRGLRLIEGGEAA